MGAGQRRATVYGAQNLLGPSRQSRAVVDLPRFALSTHPAQTGSTTHQNPRRRLWSVFKVNFTGGSSK